jgi:hypothetical protein
MQSSPILVAKSDAMKAAGDLASATRALIESFRGASPIRSAKDLERTTGLSHRVAWEIFRVGMSEDPISEAAHMPKRAAFLRFCAAAQAGGASARQVSAARRALDAFEATVQSIAGDRETFTEMAAAWCGKPNSDSAARYLRQAYRANRHVWGVYAKASFMTIVALPGEARWTLLRGLCGLRSSRRGDWDVYGSRAAHQTGNTPLEIAAQDGTNLVTKYCEGPIPELTGREQGDWHLVNAQFDVSGEIAPHTLVFGERVVRETERQLKGRLYAHFPVERLRVELITHHSLAASLASHDFYSGAVSGSRQLDAVPVDVAQRESLQGSSGFREMPSYTALLEEVVGLDGHTLDEFQQYRATCEYPPTGGVLELNLNLGDREAES